MNRLVLVSIVLIVLLLEVRKYVALVLQQLLIVQYGTINTIIPNYCCAAQPQQYKL